MNKKEQLQAIDLMELIEDSVQHHCKENMMSGLFLYVYYSQNWCGNRW